MNFDHLLQAFLEENAKLNLSALRTPEACRIGNIEDSLALLHSAERHKMQDTRCKLIDIGTGGGFPLLPLAIARPDWHCTGVDSIKKKVDAVNRIVKKLDIKNVSVIAERSEILGRKREYREQYDVVTSRAVAPLNILLEYCAPFARVGGCIVLWKSMHIDEELRESAAAQKILHCQPLPAYRYSLDGDFGQRQLLIFRKTAPVPPQYPRVVGEAKAHMLR